MTLTREVSLQTLAVLDQAETDIDRLMGSGQPDQVAAAFVFLLRLLASSSSRLQVGMALDQHDQCLQAAGLGHKGNRKSATSAISCPPPRPLSGQTRYGKIATTGFPLRQSVDGSIIRGSLKNQPAQ